VDLSFIIGGPAAEKIAIANSRLESGRSPKFERLRGLHIVVAIEEDSGLAGCFERLGVDERMKICGNDFDFLETSGAKIIRDPASRTFDVRFVFAFGTDTGDSQKFAQLRQMLVAITFYKFSKVRHGAPGGYESFRINSSET